MMPSLYMQLESGDVAERVILSGDPWRVEKLKNYLDHCKQLSFSREFNSYSGYYKGMPVSLSSTGIGAPSAAIAMEELASLGVRTVLRMGTSMCLESQHLGAFLIPRAVMQEEGSSYHAPLCYPAVPDVQLQTALVIEASQTGRQVLEDYLYSQDCFYGHMHCSPVDPEIYPKLGIQFERLRKLRIAGLDMESACLLKLGHLLGLKTAVLTLATVAADLKTLLGTEERSQSEELLCRTALEGLYRMYKEEKR